MIKMNKKVDFIIKVLFLIMLIAELYFIFIQGKYEIPFNGMFLLLIVEYNYIKGKNHKNEF